MKNNIFTERKQWVLYEKEKAKLSKLNLTCDEYDRRIKELIDKLGI